MKMKIVSILFFMMFLFPQASQADSYKWTDENGKVHYSDRKPEQNVKAVESVELDSGNFVSAEESGLKVTDEERNKVKEDVQNREKAKKEAAEEAEQRRKEKAEQMKKEKELKAKLACEYDDDDC